MSYYQYQGGPGGTATYGTGYYGYGGYPLEQRPLGWGAEGTAGRGLDYGRPYDVGTTLGNIPTEESLSLAREMWQPKCVALATNEGMLVEASLPGVKPEDIDLRIVDGDLILSGERKEQMKLSQKFRRRLWLPQGTQMNQLKASFKDGVLHVLVPLPGRGRQMGERRETMGEKQAYQEWGGMQQQQQMGERREAMEEKQTYQEWGGTQQQQQQQQQYGSGPTFQRGEEGGPMPEVGTKEETKPLLQKEKEKEMGTEERASGIFIGGGEAVTTGTSSV